MQCHVENVLRCRCVANVGGVPVSGLQLLFENVGETLHGRAAHACEKFLVNSTDGIADVLECFGDIRAVHTPL